MQLPKLRKVARENYVRKRRKDKMEELRDDIADEEFLFGDMELDIHSSTAGHAFAFSI